MSDDLIDPEVEKEVTEAMGEDPFFTEYATQKKSGGEKDTIAKDFLPNKEEMNQKTRLTPTQVIAMTRASTVGETFEELSELQPTIDKQIRLLQEHSVSLKGQGRTEIVKVLTSMFNEEAEGDLSQNAMFEMFAKNDEEND
ncbi:hypothetical protein [Methanohalobium sp.]|uniref:hypothetical protein n=1 Tax=Methanohalobium sp. TaxID=2837493 RepID=UPI0025E22660|nr:hypothetical protein [Methanohalobium sp.]